MVQSVTRRDLFRLERKGHQGWQMAPGSPSPQTLHGVPTLNPNSVSLGSAPGAHPSVLGDIHCEAQSLNRTFVWKMVLLMTANIKAPSNIVSCRTQSTTNTQNLATAVLLLIFLPPWTSSFLRVKPSSSLYSQTASERISGSLQPSLNNPPLGFQGQNCLEQILGGADKPRWMYP